MKQARQSLEWSLGRRIRARFVLHTAHTEGGILGSLRVVARWKCVRGNCWRVLAGRNSRAACESFLKVVVVHSSQLRLWLVIGGWKGKLNSCCVLRICLITISGNCTWSISSNNQKSTRRLILCLCTICVSVPSPSPAEYRKHTFCALPFFILLIRNHAFEPHAMIFHPHLSTTNPQTLQCRILRLPGFQVSCGLKGVASRGRAMSCDKRVRRVKRTDSMPVHASADEETAFR